MTYINILSLDRSRSTVVNIYLANLLSGYALGEVSSTIGPRFGEINSLKNSICACGSKSYECIFWSDILNSNNSKISFLKKTKKGIFIESSKTIRHSRWLRRNCENDLVGIFLIRSFREWSKSVLRTIEIKQEGLLKNILTQKGFRKSALRLFLRRIYIFRLFEFYITNIRLLKEVEMYNTRLLVFSSGDLNALTKCKIGKKFHNHIIKGNRAGSSFSKLIEWNSFDCFHVRLLFIIVSKFLKINSSLLL